jgi:hypothetical protein
MNASNWNAIMNQPNFDFVCDLRGINYGWNDGDINKLFEDYEYSDERLAILRQCYCQEITDSDIQEWIKMHKDLEEEEEDDNLCSACHRDYQTIDCENPCDCFCEDGEPILRKDYCQLCLVEVEKGEEYIPPSDCPHCAYPDKKWSNGCCDKCFENRLLDDDTGLCKYCTDDDTDSEDESDDDDE